MRFGIAGKGRLAALMAAEVGLLDREALGKVQTRNLSEEEIAARDRRVTRQERRHIERKRRKSE